MRYISLLLMLSVLMTPVLAQVVEDVRIVKPVPVIFPKPYGNITKLIIQPEFKYLRLKAGESKTFEVKIKNPTDKEIKITPKIVTSPYELGVDEEWISFDKTSFTLEANAEETLSITVKIPPDAEKGYYSCEIALTNDTISPPTPYEQPKFVNAIHLSVEVWIPPSVKIYPRWISERVKAGEMLEYEITVVNTGDKSFKIDPKLVEEDYYDEYSTQITEDMIDFDAPSIIPPNSNVKVKVRIHVPSGAKGFLRGSINLGINDPGLDEWRQRVDINLQVYEEPAEPFVKVINVEEAEKLTVKVSVNDYYPPVYYPVLYGIKAEESQGDVDVVIISPNGTVNVKPKILEDLFVTVGMGNPPWEEVEGIYKVTRAGKTLTYVIENPEDGQWEIRIMPKGCATFHLQIEIE